LSRPADLAEEFDESVAQERLDLLL